MGIIETEDYLNNQLQIENRHDSLLTLIDTIYPPQLCTLCDNIFNSTQESKLHYNEKHKRQSRYLCIHPHCDQRFISKGALRFHISRSHLVINAPKKDLHPSSSSTTSSPIISPILHSPLQLPSSVSISSTILSSSSPPMSKKRKKKQEKKPLLLDDDDLSAPSPPPSPFSLYNKKLSKKPILSSATESLLDSVYPPTQCPACMKVFNKKTNVIKHLAQVHSGQEPYRCIYPKCNHPRLYATREGLVYHLVRIHNEQ
ncbi:hypothetical protein G6F57_004874 [Rhizopus arrhizus]|jgi:hypothetical protein|uniref:C2H2-type domain-containing protein n=1 Tax=Rhizopus oryzae TaxID=64495 RepID=A0A9P6XE44_RHIOR|nr:hypothetical protein G6F23_001504 [Rhizopus arrhizus]KAG1424180.1 hypothetical protein G6F58_002509 [Rhizopus delemar]KAG0765352.1 hypothetical protein G6F24_004488 [Rhizopus arrhizus]KAG0791908.1 hypothetical protein G6F21_004737 [Rhizopus arrhizus]KAG0819753.1 hypothetical protein G6F20_000496 [Rhizopus arrhizus]